jgi:SNF2 family DNA or RNA helicase
MDLVSNIIANDEKVVIACRFKHDYHRLAEALDARSIEHGMLTGETAPAQRTEAIKRFRDRSSCAVFIAQMQSGSVGIDLSAARLLIFYSIGYNWADYVQMADRILDPRRPRPLGIYRLLVPNSIDRVMRRVLDARAVLRDGRELPTGRGRQPSHRRRC